MWLTVSGTCDPFSACWCCITDIYHSKVGDTRPRVFERTVSFGDSVQVSKYTTAALC